MIRLLFVACLLAFATPAAAHIQVFPTTVPAGEPTTFTIRVPNETTPDGPRTTTGIRVTFPDSVTVFSFRPPGSGFSITPLVGGNNELNGVEYRGGRIVGGFAYEDFELVGTAQEPGTAVWRVEQILDDGTRALWTGPPEAEGQAVPEPKPGAPGPAAAIEVVTAGEAAVPAGGSDEDNSDAALWLALIAAAIAAAALVLGGFLWSSRPMTLPEDEHTS